MLAYNPTQGNIRLYPLHICQVPIWQFGMVEQVCELKEFQSQENDVCHARRCIGHKWPMDQMCSKCKIHCFSHELWQKISELWNFRKFLNFR